MKKICSKCLIEKELDCFYKNKNTDDGYVGVCKECKKITYKKYYEKNIEKIKNYRDGRKEETKKYLKNYYQKNIQNIKETREKNKDKLKEKRDQFYQKNKKKLIEKSKNYYSKNKDKKKQYNRFYRENNIEKEVNRWKNYYKDNREKLIKRSSEYHRLQKKISHLYKLKHNIRGRVSDFLRKKNIKKTNKTFNIVGCDPQFLKEHIENQFIEGMSWDNYGFYGWHIDHIIPLSSAKTEEEVYKLCHYTNLQPLWSEENLKKSNKIIINE
jgi:hypothetical protein